MTYLLDPSNGEHYSIAGAMSRHITLLEKNCHAASDAGHEIILHAYRIRLITR